MAKEIMCLGKPNLEDYMLLFFYQITTPIALPGWDGTTEQGGANVVPTPSITLPEEIAGEFTAAEKAALDAGTWAFEIIESFKDEGVDQPTLVSKAQEQYADRKAEWEAAYTVRYTRYGKRYDAL